MINHSSYVIIGICNLFALPNSQHPDCSGSRYPCKSQMKLRRDFLSPPAIEVSFFSRSRIYISIQRFHTVKLIVDVFSTLGRILLIIVIDMKRFTIFYIFVCILLPDVSVNNFSCKLLNVNVKL